jgi:spore coat protein U-like protein
MSWPAKLFIALLVSGLAEPALACTATAIGVNFGTYNPRSATVTDSTGTISVTCPIIASFSVALGTGGGGSFTGRRMANGAFNLGYQLYTDSARTIVWGNGTAGTATQSFSLRTSASRRCTAASPRSRMSAPAAIRTLSW